MKFILLSISLLLVTPCFSQEKSVTAYYQKGKNGSDIILLKCNVGYYFTGPHLFIDEIFSYKIIDNKLIRNFDDEFSLYQQVDTLIIRKNSLQASNGQSYRKVRPKKKDKLIKNYITPSAGFGHYKIFLKRSKCPKDGTK